MHNNDYCEKIRPNLWCARTRIGFRRWKFASQFTKSPESSLGRRSLESQVPTGWDDVVRADKGFVWPRGSGGAWTGLRAGIRIWEGAKKNCASLISLQYLSDHQLRIPQSTPASRTAPYMGTELKYIPLCILLPH